MKLTADDLITEYFDGDLEYLFNEGNKQYLIEIEPYKVKGFFGNEKTKYRLFLKQVEITNIDKEVITLKEIKTNNEEVIDNEESEEESEETEDESKSKEE